jgi:peptidoglycan hydrolase-like protein with peptidoglycan-binding domain
MGASMTRSPRTVGVAARAARKPAPSDEAAGAVGRVAGHSRSVTAVLAMQRAVGNAAVTGVLQRLTPQERERDLVSPRLAGNPRLQAAFDNAPAMRIGERGDGVRLVQESLVADGHPMPRSTGPTGSLDGVFGSETRSAVRDFQQAHAAEGLTDASGTGDGIVGRRTLGTMDEQGGPPGPKPPDLPRCPAVLGGSERRAFGVTEALSGSAAADGAAVPCNADDVPIGSACLKSKDIPANRSGIVHQPFGSVGERFAMNVEWKDTPLFERRPLTSFCAAECGEYHQFVKGHMLSSSNQDGSNPTDVGGTMFGGQKLDENTFHEDGLDGDPKARYGHRKEPVTMNERYDPNRVVGDKYCGKDFPNVSIGTFADIDLTFLGKTVDACHHDAETSSDTWRVKFRGIIRQ